MTSDRELNKQLAPTAIKRAVMSTALQKPLTLYPAVLGALGGFYSVVFGLNPIALGVLSTGALVTLANWIYQYFMQGDHHASQMIAKIRTELEERRQTSLKHLEKDLSSINNAQARTQIKLFQDKYRNFQAILDRKLEPTELTYNRYLTIAEQVFLNGLDNLEKVALSLKSISTIDRGRIAAEMEELEGDRSETAVLKLSELKTRLELKDNQVNRVNDLLLSNEQALTQLDHVATRLANIDTRQNRAQIDMEDAMDELKQLISRADDYSTSSS